MKTLLGLLTILFLNSCFGPKYSTSYKFKIPEVEIDGISKKDSLDRSLSYSDSLIKISWTVNRNHFIFDLENVSDGNLSIDWNRAAIVDINGYSKKVINNKMQILDAGRTISPSSVPKGSKLNCMMASAENIKFRRITDRRISARTENIYFAPKGNSKTGVDEASKKDIGKSVKVMLPIEKNGVSTEYVFNFRVYDKDIRNIQKTDANSIAFFLGLGGIFTTIMVSGENF